MSTIDAMAGMIAVGLNEATGCPISDGTVFAKEAIAEFKNSETSSESGIAIAKRAFEFAELMGYKK